ncbi:MAG: hybrid sensor histidine kinase/response regulator [bacterium]|nr:hybrid sensor histidine kinase/response regulator [bacterium]
MGEEKKIDLSQFREKFAREAKARLGRLNGGLVYLGKNPGDVKLEADILREAHTLKGAARMLGFSKISELSQRFEEALARRRDKAIVANQDLADALFVTLDTLSRLVDALSQPPREPIDVDAVIDRLKLAQVYVEVPVESEAQAPSVDAPPAPAPIKDSPASISPHSGYADLGTGTRVDPARLESISNLLTNAVAHHLRELELRERLGDLGSFYRRTAASLLAAVEDGLAQGEFSPAFARRIVPLAVDGKAAFQEVGTQLSELKRRESVVSAALSQNLEELRSEVMAIRTVTLLPLFDSFHPMAGAMARELGKDVEVLVRGGKTEIDRKVAEALAEPLTHILRNAVDHGIEAPADRERAGKPRKGRIVITATPKKGRVVLEVEDDGRGIDPNEVRETAIRKGMISEKAAWRLDERELIDFVFRTGFSTAKTMTGISGVGIGMDVVRATAERFNGTSAVHSNPGKGTRVVMELPFSMAVSRVLLFLSGDQYFALPIMHADGVHSFADRDVVTVEGRKSLRMGETPVPLVWLSRLLGLPDARGPGDRYLAVMVRQAGKRIALVIDRVEGESEVVVRDLGKYLGKVPLFMGSTILGTGEVALLLDVYDLVTAVRLQADSSPEGVGEGGRPVFDADILVVDDSLLVREMQQRILVSAGYRVDTASGAKAALERLSGKRFHVVVAGARMAVMDGIQLLAEARKTDYMRDLPFILVASRENLEDLVRARAAGAKGCVTLEEFTPDRMAAMIGGILGRGVVG